MSASQQCSGRMVWDTVVSFYSLFFLPFLFFSFVIYYLLLFEDNFWNERRSAEFDHWIALHTAPRHCRHCTRVCLFLFLSVIPRRKKQTKKQQHNKQQQKEKNQQKNNTTNQFDNSSICSAEQLFTLEFYANIVGMFELNNHSIEIPSPVETYVSHVHACSMCEGFWLPCIYFVGKKKFSFCVWDMFQCECGLLISSGAFMWSCGQTNEFNLWLVSAMYLAHRYLRQVCARVDGRRRAGVRGRARRRARDGAAAARALGRLHDRRWRILYGSWLAFFFCVHIVCYARIFYVCCSFMICLSFLLKKLRSLWTHGGGWCYCCSAYFMFAPLLWFSSYFTKIHYNLMVIGVVAAPEVCSHIVFSSQCRPPLCLFSSYFTKTRLKSYGWCYCCSAWGSLPAIPGHRLLQCAQHGQSLLRPQRLFALWSHRSGKLRRTYSTHMYTHERKIRAKWLSPINMHVRQVSLRALRDIAEGEEICVSYIDETLDVQDRAEELCDYDFVCQCAKCVAER